MKVQTFEAEASNGCQVRVSIQPGAFGAFVAVRPKRKNPMRQLTEFVPVKWVSREDMRYILK